MVSQCSWRHSHPSCRSATQWWKRTQADCSGCSGPLELAKRPCWMCSRGAARRSGESGFRDRASVASRSHRTWRRLSRRITSSECSLCVRPSRSLQSLRALPKQRLTSCWMFSGSPKCSTHELVTRAAEAYLAASGGGWRWAVPCSAHLRCWLLTSRPRGWTRTRRSA